MHDSGNVLADESLEFMPRKGVHGTIEGPVPPDFRICKRRGEADICAVYACAPVVKGGANRQQFVAVHDECSPGQLVQLHVVEDIPYRLDWLAIRDHGQQNDIPRLMSVSAGL